jgi:hypothetical protein
MKALGNLRIRNLAVVVIALLGIAACGSKPPPPVTPPAPANPYGAVGGAGCGAMGAGGPGVVQGYGTLQSRFGGNNSMSVTVTPLNPAQGFQYGPYPQNVLGNGCILLGDLPGLLQAIGYRGTVNGNQGIAITSNSTGVPSVGTFNPSSATLSLTLTGQFPIQLVSPFTGYPGGYSPGGGYGTGMGTELLTVRIGPQLGSAGIPSNRLQGQILVTIGQGGMTQANTISYIAQ